MGIFAPTKPGSENSIFTAAGLFLATTWITLSLRIWVRTALAKSFGCDDAILLLSALSFTGFCAVVIAIETVGGAQHIDQLDIPALTQTVGMVVATFGLYISTMVLFKISLGIFYLRFIIRPWQRYVVHTTVAINTFYGLLLFFVAVFQCGDPTQYLQNELRGICMPNGPLFVVQLTGAIINATTDWTLAILPIFVLAKANMPRPTKISAGFILLLGCSGSIISLIRIQYIKELRPGPDFFRSVTNVAIWSIAECGICISAAAAAALRPLVRGLIERTGHSLMQTRSFGSHLKSLQGPSNNARQSEPLFGDWGTHTAQHRMADVESQRELNHRLSLPTPKTVQEWSSGSDSREMTPASLTPVMHNARILSKMGLSSEDIETHGKHTNDQKPSGQNVSRPEDQPRATNDGRSRQNRPGISRNRSIRERGISRPVPHESCEMVPPTPTFGARPQQVLLIDSRRRGSPDWTKGNNQAWPPRTHSMSPRRLPNEPSHRPSDRQYRNEI